MSKQRNMKSDERWESVQIGIDKLKNSLEGEAKPARLITVKEYMEYYTNIYNIFNERLDKRETVYEELDRKEKVYEKYREIYEDYFSSTVLPSLREKNNEFLLREFVKRWSNNKIMVRWLSSFFYHLDRYFIPQRSLPTLKEVGLFSFRDMVYQELKGKVRDALISLIDQEREGEKIDRPLLKNVVDIFVEIGEEWTDCYEEDFETAMLEDTTTYYSIKAFDWSSLDSSRDYLLIAKECLKREKERVSHYLHSSSETKLLKKVRHALLSSSYATQLMEQEQSKFHASLRDGKLEDLSRTYGLFPTVLNNLEPFTNIFKQHIAAEVTDLVKQTEDGANNKKADKKDLVGLQEQVLVGKVIELQDKYLPYVEDLFMNHSLFHKALSQAFGVFCNKGVAESSGAEILATFCDNILKKGGSKKLNDEDIEETLEKVVRLVGSVHDKDVFSELYRRKFSRRLLFDESPNYDHERNTITKLKHRYGHRVTLKMEGMLKNYMLADEVQDSFEEYLGNNPRANPGVDLTVTVLTAGFWPSYKSSNLNLSAEMVKCVNVFGDFYKTKRKGRRLTWIYSLGSCKVEGNFEQKTMELIVTPYQVAVLLLFNESDRLSYQEIVAQLGLSDDDIVRLLHSLSCAKYKILSKEPNTKTISHSDVFEYNSKFTYKMRRIKIPLPRVNQEEVSGDVIKDRRFVIDASLVRIMKSRKVLDYQKLVMECKNQLSQTFTPEVKAIKKRIEDLIDFDYLERDEDNPKLIKYLA